MGDIYRRYRIRRGSEAFVVEYRWTDGDSFMGPEATEITRNGLPFDITDEEHERIVQYEEKRYQATRGEP